MTGVLLRRENRDIRKGESHVMTEVEMGLTHLETKEHQGLSAATRGQVGDI